MQLDKRVNRWLCGAGVFVCCLASAVGCQSWRSSGAIPGLGSTKGERQVLKQAKHDPFPSPSDVGMEMTK